MKTLLLSLALLLSPVAAQAYELDVHARAAELPTPAYPPPQPYEAKDGIVSVLIEVDANGSAKATRIMCSSSNRFIEATLSAFKRWRFLPAKRGGRPSGDTLEFILIFSPNKKVEAVGPLYAP